MIRSLVGTVNWQAPELWSPHPRYDYKVDVFSAGLVFWEMLSGWTGDKVCSLVSKDLGPWWLTYRNTPGKAITSITSMMLLAPNNGDLVPPD